jgi:hypothetical protein
VADAPPAPKRPLKREAPRVGDEAPFPPFQRKRTSGQWEQRLASLTIATDPLYFMQVGINALLELRYDQRVETSVTGVEGLPGMRLLLPLWGHEALPTRPGGVLAVLEREVLGLLTALEVVLVVEGGPFERFVQAVRKRAIAESWERVEQVVCLLRKQVKKRKAVQRMAHLLVHLAWKVLAGQDTRARPSLPGGACLPAQV